MGFQGSVVDVPSLKAPGFIKAQTDKGTYPDVTHCEGIKINAKSENGFKGFRFSFGDRHPLNGKFFAYGYKQSFAAPAPVDTFVDVLMPFDNFTDLWDDATGEPITTCAQNSRYCPDDKALKNPKTLSVWAEGV